MFFQGGSSVTPAVDDLTADTSSKDRVDTQTAEPPSSPSATNPESNNCTVLEVGNTKKLYSAQYARMAVNCVECRKPRVIYSKQRLSERQKVNLCVSMSECDYTCGAPLLPPNDPYVSVAVTKQNLVCAQPIEISFYSASIGRRDLCAHCGIEEAHTNEELKTKYRTVLPICDECEQAGKSPIVQRPYGRSMMKKK